MKNIKKAAWVNMIIITGWFVPSDFKYQNEKRVTGNRAPFSINFQSKTAPRWLSNFFHFGTENQEDPLKNHHFLLVYLGNDGQMK